MDKADTQPPLLPPRQKGTIIWEKVAPQVKTRLIDKRNNAASPSPAVEDNGVYVFFPDYGLIAYDARGTQLWTMPLGPFSNIYGMGASPIIVGDLLVLACDQSLGSYVMALDKRTGQVRWKVDRPEAKSGHSTPILWKGPDGKDQILLPGSFLLTAYDAATGKKLWWVGGLSFEMKSTPVIGGDTIYVNGYGAPVNDPGNKVNVPPAEEVWKTGQHRPVVVMHMAAQSLVLPSYEDPLTTYATNIMGTANLLEAVRHCGSVRVVINVTSDKCYENRGGTPGFRETDPMGGFDPYSSSKGCAELVTAAYRHSFFKDGNNPIAIASTRAGNVIGGGDWSSYRLVPDIMRAFIAHRSAEIRNPEAIRPWQHVLEPLGGYLLLAEHMWRDPVGFSEAWNFGPNEMDACPVSWIADELTRLWGGKATWKVDTSNRSKEAATLRLDCAKAKSRLHWQPKLDLPTALAWTVEWYKS